jgi:uncharacterized protein YegP (UPF0339 family)
MKIEYLKAKNGQFFARIKAKNGKILAVTETYTRRRGPKTAVELIGNAFYGGTIQEVELW